MNTDTVMRYLCWLAPALPDAELASWQPNSTVRYTIHRAANTSNVERKVNHVVLLILCSGSSNINAERTLNVVH